MNKKPFISVYLAQVLLKYAADHGIHLDEGGKAYHDLSTLEGTTPHIPIERFLSLWNEVSQRSGDANFGLHFGEAANRLASGHPLNALLMNCATVESALERSTCYHGFITNLTHTRLYKKGSFAHRVIDPAYTNLPINRHPIEASFSALVGTIRLLTQNKARFVAVHFAHHRPEDIGEHEQIFACPVYFSQLHNELVFPVEVLSWPIQMANPHFLKRLEPMAQAMLGDLYAPNTWASRIAYQINQKLARGEKVTLANVAKALSIGSRQLQNKLREENVTFQSLLDEQRKEIALRYLSDDTFSLNEIACLLGFSGQSAFNHAFKRWTGQSPTQYRK